MWKIRSGIIIAIYDSEISDTEEISTGSDNCDVPGTVRNCDNDKNCDIPEANENCDISDADYISTSVIKNEKTREHEDNFYIL